MVLEQAIRSAYRRDYKVQQLLFFDDKVLGALRYWNKLTLFDEIMRQRLSCKPGQYIYITTFQDEDTIHVTPCLIRAIFTHTYAGINRVFFAVHLLDISPPHPPQFDRVYKYRLERSEGGEKIYGLPMISSRKSPHLIPTTIGQRLDQATEFWLNDGVVPLV